MKKYLFLCSVGVNRSPTATKVAGEIAKQKGLELEALYGGYDIIEEERIPKEHFDDYDLIIVMESYMEKGLVKLGIRQGNLRT